MAIVAWYVPSFANPARDQRRSLAAIRFRTAGGERFDSFALDIESSVVKAAGLRNARLLQLSRQLRAAAPPAFRSARSSRHRAAYSACRGTGRTSPLRSSRRRSTSFSR
jgi:hypothetical protein